MASSPITSWQIDGETMETVRDFIVWGPKITGDGDCINITAQVEAEQLYWYSVPEKHERMVSPGQK